MKFFLDSAKLNEIETAWETFGIDGVTTNPRHIQNSGKPFMTAIGDIADWIRRKGLDGKDVFPVSVEINPHLTDAEEIEEAARKIAAISPNFVISFIVSVVIRSSSFFSSPHHFFTTQFSGSASSSFLP